jgi:hypothetical protein
MECCRGGDDEIEARPMEETLIKRMKRRGADDKGDKSGKRGRK